MMEDIDETRYAIIGVAEDVALTKLTSFQENEIRRGSIVLSNSEPSLDSS